MQTLTLKIAFRTPENLVLNPRGPKSPCWQGWIQGEIEAIAPSDTYESNFIHHSFVQFGKEHSRYKAISSSIVLSQLCCEAYFIYLSLSYSSESVVRLNSVA